MCSIPLRKKRRWGWPEHLPERSWENTAKCRGCPRSSRSGRMGGKAPPGEPRPLRADLRPARLTGELTSLSSEYMRLRWKRGQCSHPHTSDTSGCSHWQIQPLALPSGSTSPPPGETARAEVRTGQGTRVTAAWAELQGGSGDLHVYLHCAQAFRLRLRCSVI